MFETVGYQVDMSSKTSSGRDGGKGFKMVRLTDSRQISKRKTENGIIIMRKGNIPDEGV